MRENHMPPGAYLIAHIGHSTKWCEHIIWWKPDSRGYNGQTGEDLSTLDIDVPALEAALSMGGFSETSYQRFSLVATSGEKP